MYKLYIFSGLISSKEFKRNLKENVINWKKNDLLLFLACKSLACHKQAQSIHCQWSWHFHNEI